MLLHVFVQDNISKLNISLLFSVPIHATNYDEKNAFISNAFSLPCNSTSNIF